MLFSSCPEVSSWRRPRRPGRCAMGPLVGRGGVCRAREVGSCPCAYRPPRHVRVLPPHLGPPRLRSWILGHPGGLSRSWVLSSWPEVLLPRSSHGLSAVWVCSGLGECGIVDGSRLGHVVSPSARLRVWLPLGLWKRRSQIVSAKMLSLVVLEWLDGLWTTGLGIPRPSPPVVLTTGLWTTPMVCRPLVHGPLGKGVGGRPAPRFSAHDEESGGDQLVDGAVDRPQVGADHRGDGGLARVGVGPIPVGEERVGAENPPSDAAQLGRGSDGLLRDCCESSHGRDLQ